MCWSFRRPNSGCCCTARTKVRHALDEGGMPAQRRLLLEEHLAACDGCQTYLEQLRATIRLAGTLREDDLGPQARAALLGVFRDWKRQRASRPGSG